MKSLLYLICYFFLLTSISVAQGLNLSDLSKLAEMSVNDGETFLTNKKFEFSQILKDNENWIDYAFGLNLNEYGNGEEYLVLSFDQNGNKRMVWYQLSKQGWQKLKDSLNSLGYKKIKTEAEPDGSLSTEYENTKFTLIFTSGASKENFGVFTYTLTVLKRD